MVTHGDGGSFWSVVKKGAEEAARTRASTRRSTPSNNDPQKQAQLIDAAVSQKVDGLAVSAPNPDAIARSLAKAQRRRHPDHHAQLRRRGVKELGAITHVGQTETIAGQAAGAKLKEAGAKKLLCVIHEQSNIGLNQRCDGAKQGFGGDVENLQVKGTADVATTQTEIKSKLAGRQVHRRGAGAQPGHRDRRRDAIKGASSEAKLATFDLTGDVIEAIKDGSIAFAVDQQQYLQGYLPIVFLTLYKTNANTVGGGQPVLTGPGFVDENNADTVEKLAEEGTR